jgi:hypothetical protein
VPRCDLASRTEFEFPQNVLDVPLGGALANHEFLGDLLIRQARGHKRRDLALSCGQLRARFTCRRRSRLGYLDRERQALIDGPPLELPEIPRCLRLAPGRKDRRKLSLGSLSIAGAISPE